MFKSARWQCFYIPLTKLQHGPSRYYLHLKMYSSNWAACMWVRLECGSCSERATCCLQRKPHRPACWRLSWPTSTDSTPRLGTTLTRYHRNCTYPSIITNYYNFAEYLTCHVVQPSSVGASVVTLHVVQCSVVKWLEIARVRDNCNSRINMDTQFSVNSSWYNSYC